MMRKKDFIAFAGTTARMIKECKKADLRTGDIIINECVSFCKDQNPLFNESRFLSKVEELLK